MIALAVWWAGELQRRDRPSESRFLASRAARITPRPERPELAFTAIRRRNMSRACRATRLGSCSARPLPRTRSPQQVVRSSHAVKLWATPAVAQRTGRRLVQLGHGVRAEELATRHAAVGRADTRPFRRARAARLAVSCGVARTPRPRTPQTARFLRPSSMVAGARHGR